MDSIDSTESTSAVVDDRRTPKRTITNAKAMFLRGLSPNDGSSGESSDDDHEIAEMQRRLNALKLKKARAKKKAFDDREKSVQGSGGLSTTVSSEKVNPPPRAVYIESDTKSDFKTDFMESDISPSMSDFAMSDSRNVRLPAVRLCIKSDLEEEIGLQIGLQNGLQEIGLENGLQNEFQEIGLQETPRPITKNPSSIRQPNITYNSVLTWDDAFENWIRDAASSATRKNFRVQGGKFFKFLDQRKEGKPSVPAQLQPYHLNEYKNHLQDETELSQNSIHVGLITVKSFCTWLFNEKVTDRNVGVKLKAPPYVPPEMEAITKPEIYAMFEASDEEQRLFLCFGYWLAIRVGALVSLKRKNIRDINFETKTFMVTWLAKGRRRVSKTFSNWNDLPKDWVRNMEKYEPEEYLLKGRKKNSHITDRTARRWMKQLGKECEIQLDLDGESRITPHDLRHSGATIIADESGGNQFQLKEHLHHKNIGTSQHYVHSTKTSLKERENMLYFGNKTPEQFRHK